ncbi:MAG TPA: 4-(cytidine 5'-diphospho)-2-C-methyl-D-erythritol kinase [Mycobacterium sp.]|nr:4-(cytidine 5'-diphospho)-2-C-methyl-D-erythritol kinase [Mycobacterium sp.]
MPSVTVRVPAKVNVALAVGPRRPDGFHDLATVFHAVSLYDEVVARSAEDFSVTAEGVGSEQVPRDDSNLAMQAARTLAAYSGVTSGAGLHIRKEIPVAAGMAGGSADAAGALVACDALWGTGLGRPELAILAARVGSDVPFALMGGTALGTGRGERLTPAMVGGVFHWVLAMSDQGLAAPAVYAKLDELRSNRTILAPGVAPDVLAALRAADAQALGRLLENDLQEAACALAPELTAILEAGRGLGALGAIVSGSGPTCAFLVRDVEHGIDLAIGLSSARLAADVRRVTGPVSGPRIVG